SPARTAGSRPPAPAGPVAETLPPGAAAPARPPRWSIVACACYNAPSQDESATVTGMAPSRGRSPDPLPALTLIGNAGIRQRGVSGLGQDLLEQGQHPGIVRLPQPEQRLAPHLGVLVALGQ